METAEVSSAWYARRKAGVLREAVEATGGPDSDAVAGVKNYIDRQHPGFDWSGNWAGEILGAKAAMRSTSQSAPCDGPNRGRQAAPLQFDENDIRAAREFVDQIGEGCVEKARWVLDFLSRVGEPARLKQAVDIWAELLEAVGGNPEAAEKVMAVVNRRFLSSPFPRIAQQTVESEAA